MRGTFLGLAILGGCTLGRLDGLTGGAAPDAMDATDAGVDSAAVASATSASDAGTSPDAGAEVLLSNSFADATTCDEGSFNSLLFASPNGHTDAHACRVCGQRAGPGSFSYVREVPGGSATVAARYHATAWYRNPVSGAPPASISFAVRSFLRSPFAEVETSAGFGTSTADWRRIDADLVLTKPADGIDVFIAAPFGAGVCFVFDDLVVTRLN